MYYRIVSDIPGRLRLRCGKLIFDEQEAYGISSVLFDLDGVKHAEVHPANGSILIVFEPNKRAQVLAVVDSFDVAALPALEAGDPTIPIEVRTAFEDNRFAHRVFNLFAWHFARRLLLPWPARFVVAVVQASRFVYRGIRALASGHLTVDVLDATAIVAMIARLNITEASSIMLMLTLSSIIEDHVEKCMRLSLSQGLITRPEKVWAVIDGKDTEVPMSSVVPGMVLHLPMGAAMPVDGTVVSGDGEVDEATMTGESRLVHKSEGSTVYAGTTLEVGDMFVQVVKPAGEARIDQIVRMVIESSSLKATAQSQAERLANRLVPFSFFGFFAIWFATHNICNAMVLLLVDYSCAIRLSMPIAVISAMSEAYRHDMVVKGGRYLENFADADMLVFDKTGTLTYSRPAVDKVLVFGDDTEEEVLTLAACIEEHFPHSMARAIVDSAEERGLHHEDERHTKVNYMLAHGINTEVDGKRVCIGSHHFIFDDEGVPEPESLLERIEAESPASSVVYLSRDGQLLGALCINDPIRPEAKEVVRKLHERGVEDVIMLTGDSLTAARTVAHEAGVDHYRSQVLPEQKSAIIRELREQGHKVIMVGDGINDSPALAAADVSLAMNDASDVARNVADITVLNDSLESLITMRDLAVVMQHRIQANYDFIVVYNTMLIALGLATIIPATAAAYLHNLATLALALMNTRDYLPDDTEDADGGTSGNWNRSRRQRSVRSCNGLCFRCDERREGCRRIRRAR